MTTVVMIEGIRRPLMYLSNQSIEKLSILFWLLMLTFPRSSLPSTVRLNIVFE